MRCIYSTLLFYPWGFSIINFDQNKGNISIYNRLIAACITLFLNYSIKNEWLYKIEFRFWAKMMLPTYISPVFLTPSSIATSDPKVFWKLYFSYGGLFFARSLQGLGSALADTSALALVADRFTDDNERQKALGISLAFISFGSLVAPPLGGFLFQYINHAAPFIFLAFCCLLDAILVGWVSNSDHLRKSLHKSVNKFCAHL